MNEELEFWKMVRQIQVKRSNGKGKDHDQKGRGCFDWSAFLFRHFGAGAEAGVGTNQLVAAKFGHWVQIATAVLPEKQSPIIFIQPAKVLGAHLSSFPLVSS